jgi:YVTN family beta-propeller protein
VISRRTLLALPLLAGCGKSGSGYEGFAWVATQGSKSLAVVDLLAFTVKHRIALEAGPSKLARGPKALYALLPETLGVAEIDPAKRTLTRVVRMPGEPLAARLQPGGEQLWVLAGPQQPSLVPIATATGKAGRGIALDAAPVGFAIAPERGEAVVTLATGAVQFVDLKTGRAHPAVALDGGAAAPLLGEVRYRTDGKVVLVADRARHRITVLDAESRQVMTQLPLALSPDHLSMKDDGGQLFVTGAGRDAVVIVYPYRTEIAQTSLSGRRPGSMASASAPPYLFVSNPEAGSVTVFDVTTQKVVAVTGVGVRPGTIAVTPDQQYALVLNEASGDMAVIRIAAISPGREKRAPLFTMIPVGERPVDLRVLPA